MNPVLAHRGTPDEIIGTVLFFVGLWSGIIGLDRIRAKGFRRIPRWGGYALIGLAIGLILSSVVVPRILSGPQQPAATDRSLASSPTVPVQTHHTTALAMHSLSERAERG